MRQLSRILPMLLVGALLLGPCAGFASATTIDDLIKLKSGKTPVSDDVLIALIESDGSIFHLTADDIPVLKQKGLSDRVIIAMLLTAAKARGAVEPVNVPAPLPGAASYQPANPQYDAVANTMPGAAVAQQPPPVVNVSQTVTQTVEQPQNNNPYGYNPYGYYQAVYVPFYAVAPVVHRPVAPVYWGYGGQRRPDAWGMTPQEQRATQAASKPPDGPRPAPRSGAGGGR